MDPTDKTHSKTHALNRLLTRLVHRFSLREDKADDNEIERRIRDGVELIGATPWILIFAIFVASVGLNVNSTAVIIGAMLISPLMGPIMGVGLGVAVYDFSLAKRALLNLGIATLISMIVSALYFSVSPLHQAQSELLARTTPYHLGCADCAIRRSGRYRRSDAQRKVKRHSWGCDCHGLDAAYLHGWIWHGRR